MLKRIPFFRKKISDKKKQKNIAADKDHRIYVRERERVLYGDDALSKQRLYEAWMSREEWVLKSEGILLLLGMDPARYDANNTAENLKEEMASLWRHARDCAAQNLLAVVNLEQAPEEWRVAPITLYQWAAISRISMPKELVDLAKFVLRTVEKTVYTGKETNTPELNESKNVILHQKIALGAALALLANNREECLGETIGVDAGKIAAQIIDNKSMWFKQDKPLLSQTAMRDLIEGYLNSGTSAPQNKD